MDIRTKNSPISYTLLFTTLLVVLALSACGTDGGGNTTNPPQNDETTEKPLSGPDDGTDQTSETTDTLPDDTSPLSDELWRATLDGVLDVLNDDALILVNQAMRRLVQPEGPSGAAVEEINFSTEDGGGTVLRVSCTQGGSFELATISSEVGKAIVTAQNCMMDDMSIDGRIQRSTQVNSAGSEIDTESLDNFIVEDATMRVQVFEGYMESENGHPVTTSSLSGMSYQVERAGGTRLVNNMELTDVDLWGYVHDRYLSGSFTVSAPWSLNQPIVVTMPTSIRGLPVNSTQEFTSGQLVLTTVQGDRLILDADSNQDDDSAMVTLEIGGSVTTTILPWADIFAR